MTVRMGMAEVFPRVAVRAISDALYEKLLDECWEEIQAVMDAPRVREARRRFLRLMAEELASRREADDAD